MAPSKKQRSAKTVPEIPRVPRETPGRVGIHIYDPEKHRAQPDALGNEPTSGRRYLKGFEECRIVTADGDVMRVEMTPDGRGIRIRNQGRTIRSGLMVPMSGATNVVEIRPFDY